MRDSITLYRTQIRALLALDAEDLKQSLQVITDYALDEKEPECGGVPFAMWMMTKPLIDKNNKNYENSKKRSASEPEANGERTESEPQPNEERTDTEPEANGELKVKGKRLKVKEENKRESRRFTPPTKQEVQQYISEQGYTVDADKFVDFYTSKGWMVGKNPMKDWKAAVRNWQRSQRQETTANGTRQERTAKVTAFSNFQQRSYDMKALEKALTGGGAK